MLRLPYVRPTEGLCERRHHEGQAVGVWRRRRAILSHHRLTEALTRKGFDQSRHPLSLLSLGEAGWIQIGNFVATGALNVACAAGMRRTLANRSGGTWAPGLLGGFGIGLIIAGVFVTDAGAGFPPGAPFGAPERLSWHAVVHEIGFLLSVV